MHTLSSEKVQPKKDQFLSFLDFQSPASVFETQIHV